jgi:hypothetical protein
MIKQGVRQAVENCLKVQPGEKALVITNDETIMDKGRFHLE